MVSQVIVSTRHRNGSELLEKTLEGERDAISKVFLYLSSPDPTLRKNIQESIHDITSQELWEQLLSCLAIQCWLDHRDCDKRVDQEASQRIDQSITEVFVEDEVEREVSIKESVLRNALIDERIEFRYAAACLLGLRGDLEMIPLLEEILENAVKSWKVRAVHALAAIRDERCVMPLIRALAMDRGALHSEAKIALKKLGALAEKGWCEALVHPDSRIRWHAARGLGDATEVRSIDVLAEGLLDESPQVRWTTSDVLARIGPPAVPATLQVISKATLTTPTRQAAYHALHGVLSRRLRERLKPILEALQSPAASVDAPQIAQQLLQEWEVNL